MINIVSGIIIDTFEHLRKKDNNKLKDMEEVCFICGYNREIFDKQSDNKGGFNAHIKKDHYMWNYLYYLAYLNNKDQSEYTGIESYV